MSSTDRIAKHIVVRASQARVWQALSDSKQFGAWFLVAFDGPFVVGKWIAGRTTHPEWKNFRFEALIEQMIPERLFSYRWHPYAVEPQTNYANEPTTLVQFELTTVPEGTRIDLVESGFDALPDSRRSIALRMNTGGWIEQLENVKRYVEV